MPTDSRATLASRIAEARAAIAASRFARWTNTIAARLEPSVRLEPLDGGGLGCSRLGAEPMLPSDRPWPAGDGGRPLEFLAQADLADVTRLLGNHRLPSEGLLCFFASGEEGRVVHLSTDLVLSPRCCCSSTRIPPALTGTGTTTTAASISTSMPTTSSATASLRPSP